MSRFRYFIDIRGDLSLNEEEFHGGSAEPGFEAFRAAVESVSLSELIHDWGFERHITIEIEDREEGHSARLHGGSTWYFTDNSEALDRQKFEAETEGMSPLFAEATP